MSKFKSIHVFDNSRFYYRIYSEEKIIIIEPEEYPYYNYHLELEKHISDIAVINNINYLKFRIFEVFHTDWKYGYVDPIYINQIYFDGNIARCKIASPFYSLFIPLMYPIRNFKDLEDLFYDNQFRRLRF